MRFAVGVRTNE